MSEQPSEQPERDDTEAGSYVDLQKEVDRNFKGNWGDFLKAVQNPAEILYFVLWRQCDGKADKIEAWSKEKDLPPDWMPRFFGMLTHEGKFRPDAVTRPKSAPPPSAEQTPPSDGASD